jgi:hypothetical protein
MSFLAKGIAMVYGRVSAREEDMEIEAGESEV